MSLLRRLLNLGRDDALTRDIEREVAFHLREREDELRAQGMSEPVAALEARRQFGNPTFQRERTRDADIIAWLDSLAGDVRYALRALGRSPVFTFVAVASLALGIGANTAIYTLLDAVVIAPLPVPHPDQLVQVTLSEGDDPQTSFTNPLWEQLRDRQQALTSVTAFSETDINLAEGGEVRRAHAELVSGQFFTVFGMQPAVGRLLTPADDQRGCPPTVVLSWGFWQREYGGAPSAVGRSLRVSGTPFEIVGVTRPGFTGPVVGRESQLYFPMCAEAVLSGRSSILDERSTWWLRVVGRRDGSTSLAQVNAQLAPLARAAYDNTIPPKWSVKEQAAYVKDGHFGAIPVKQGISGVRDRYRQALLVMMGAVALVLLIACANVANLLLARATARQRELAVRLALGAARRRIVRQLLTESALLAALGAVGGMLIAHWGSRALVSLIPTGSGAVALDLGLNLRVLGFTILTAVLTATFFGLVPALRGTRVSPQTAMKANARGVAEGHGRFTLGKALVVAQVALSLILLVGAALLVTSLRNLASVDPGFDAKGVLIVDANFQQAKLTPERLTGLRPLLLDRLRALPGVVSASAPDLTPIGGTSWNDDLVVEGFVPAKPNDAVVWFNQVTDGYFKTMGTRLIAGRDFNHDDGPTTPRSAIINEMAAHKFFGNASPLGKQFRTPVGDGLSDPYTIVGVVQTAKYRSLRETDSYTVYLPESQSDTHQPQVTLTIRALGDPSTLMAPVKEVIAGISQNASIEFRTLDDQVARSLQRERLLAVLAALFGGVALVLSVMGLYGVMAYTVARRRNEIGVRIALGAGRARVLRIVLVDVARVIGVGLSLGAIGALVSGKLVSSFLFGLAPGDPIILLAVAGVLAVVAFAAGLGPALRASRMDPVSALRED